MGMRWERLLITLLPFPHPQYPFLTNQLRVQSLGTKSTREAPGNRWRRKKERSRDTLKGEALRTITSPQVSSASYNQGEATLPPEGLWINSTEEPTGSRTSYMLGRHYANVFTCISSFNLTATPRGGYYYYFHFTDGATEAQRSKMSHPSYTAV